MTRPHWSAHLKKMGACTMAVTWAQRQPSLGRAWRTCNNPSWLLWYIGKTVKETDTISRRKLVTIACACVRTVAHHNPDPRVMAAITTAERIASGELVGDAATSKALIAALSAAGAAASAANVVARAAASATEFAASVAVSVPKGAVRTAVIEVSGVLSAVRTAGAAERAACPLIRRQFPRPPRRRG